MVNPSQRDPDCCPICSGTRDRLDLPIQDPVWRCRNCAHVERLHPQSSLDYHRSDYRKNFRRQSSELDDNGIVQEEFHAHRARIVARRLRRIGQWLRLEDRCLDIGCGAGTFAAAVRPLVTSVLGLEVDPNLVAETQALGFECLESDFFTALLQPEFDVLFLWHVLEHLQEPQALKERVRELSPRLLVLEVPHSRKLSDKFDGHYHYYTPQSLELLFSDSLKIMIEPGIQAPAWLAVFEVVPKRPLAGTPCEAPNLTARSGRVNVVVGDACFEMADYQSANLQYTAASRAGIEPSPLKYAICRWMLNEDPSAENALLKTDIADVAGFQGKNLLRNLASLFRKHEDWPRALFCLERALAVEPVRDATTYLELFRTLASAGRMPEAGAILHEALEHCPNALPLLEAGVLHFAQAGLDPKPLANRAIALLLRGLAEGNHPTGSPERRKQDLGNRRIEALRPYADSTDNSPPDLR